MMLYLDLSPERLEKVLPDTLKLPPILRDLADLYVQQDSQELQEVAGYIMIKYFYEGDSFCEEFIDAQCDFVKDVKYYEAHGVWPEEREHKKQTNLFQGVTLTC